MFEAWGRALSRRRRLTLVITLLFVAFAGAWGTGVFSKLSSGDNFTPPSSQSQREANAAEQAFGRNDADVVVLYRSATMTVTDPAYRQAVTTALSSLPRADVARVSTYWSTGSPSLVSTDRHSTYAVLQLTGADDAARHQTYDAIKNELNPGPAWPPAASPPGSAGTWPLEVAINNEVTADIAKAEGFSMPVLLILLLVIFGSLAAAVPPAGDRRRGHPRLVYRAAAAHHGHHGVHLLGEHHHDPGPRPGHRLRAVHGHQVPRGTAPPADRWNRAVARTGRDRGPRRWPCPGVTVAVALTSLMLFPVDFLRSMGYGGVATVAVDVLAALTVLPALLAVLGHRVNALRIRRSVQRAPRDESSGAWYRLARSVMRRPLVYVTVITIALLALAAPFLRISWGGTDARTLPAASTIRQVSQTLDSQFPVNSTDPIEALITGAGASSARALASYLHRIDAIPGVTGAQVTGAKGNTIRVDVGYTPAPVSSAARHIVTQIRALAPPAGATVLVGGTTAGLVDELASLGATLPWMALLVCVSTFVLLFLAFGSVVLPLKAIVMNVLSLGATFGVVVWIFQWGHLSGLLRFTPTGSIDPTMPILMAGHHLRPVHGLRGVPAVQDPGAVRPDRRQRRGGRGRPAADRRRDHQPGPAADHRGRRVLGVRHHVHQADGRGHDRRAAGGRDRGPDPAGAGHDAAARPGQLVGAAPAAPPVRQVRDQGGQPGAGPGAGRRGKLTGRLYPRARAAGLRVQC